MHRRSDDWRPDLICVSSRDGGKVQYSGKPLRVRIRLTFNCVYAAALISLSYGTRIKPVEEVRHTSHMDGNCWQKDIRWSVASTNRFRLPYNVADTLNQQRLSRICDASQDSYQRLPRRIDACKFERAPDGFCAGPRLYPKKCVATCFQPRNFLRNPWKCSRVYMHRRTTAAVRVGSDGHQSSNR